VHKSIYEGVLVLVPGERAACAASLVCVFDEIVSMVDVHLIIIDRWQKVAVLTSR